MLEGKEDELLPVRGDSSRPVHLFFIFFLSKGILHPERYSLLLSILPRVVDIVSSLSQDEITVKSWRGVFPIRSKIGVEEDFL
jgi:hypothetical protein